MFINELFKKDPRNSKANMAEAKAATAAFRRGNKKRAELNAMSDEERRAYDKEQQEKQRKRDDARLERERQKLATKKLGEAPVQAPAQTVQQRADATQQRLLDKMGARFGLPPGSSAEQVQAAQQAYLDKNDPKAAAQYKQNMANIDAGNTAANKPVQLATPQAQAPQTMQQQDPDFYAGMQAQKAGGSPLDIMLAQPSIANNQQLLDAIGSAYGLPAGSTIEQIKAAASGKPAPATQTNAVTEGNVTESNVTIGHEILGMLRQVKRQGHDAMEELYSSCPLLAQFWDQYEGDFRSMVIELSPKTLNRIKAEIAAFNQQGVAKGLNEFAPPGSNDGGDDGFSEETLKRLAAQWYNGGEDPRVERTLMAAGWEIGQDEGYDDEPGVFVVRAGDTNGDSYLSWTAHELKQGVAEATETEIEKHIMEMRHAGYDLVEGYGSYYCSTKKRMVQRKGPKQSRSSK